MSPHRQKTAERPFHHHASTGLKAVVASAALIVLTYFSWNLFAPDLLGLPAMGLKEALGVVLFGGVVSVLVRHGGRRA